MNPADVTNTFMYGEQVTGMQLKPQSIDLQGIDSIMQVGGLVHPLKDMTTVDHEMVTVTWPIPEGRCGFRNHKEVRSSPTNMSSPK
jgi:hypothetical protein